RTGGGDLGNQDLPPNFDELLPQTAGPGSSVLCDLDAGPVLDGVLDRFGGEWITGIGIPNGLTADHRIRRWRAVFLGQGSGRRLVPVVFRGSHALIRSRQRIRDLIKISPRKPL